MTKECKSETELRLEITDMEISLLKDKIDSLQNQMKMLHIIISEMSETLRQP